MGKYYDAALVLRGIMDKAGAMLTDAQALKVQGLFPAWNVEATYAVGDRVKYNGTLYRCLTAHTAQATWTPTDAPSLWAKVLTDPSGAILPWVQPDSTNPYKKGDRVRFNGKVYESLIDNNVWSPSAYPAGWREVSA